MESTWPDGQQSTAEYEDEMPGNYDDRWTDQLGPSWVDRLVAADPGVLDDISAWWQNTSPVPRVGSRHHTVPRFYLERFAAADQLWVRDRVTGVGRTENISRAGTIRDFYTFINLNGEKDGRLEHILAEVEGGAKEVFDRLLSPLQRPRPLAANESMRVALFLAFQLLRTPRHRREVELMGDYIVRTQHRHVRGISQVRVVPDPNFHLEYMTKAVFKLSEVFYGRPTMLVTLDQPLFITCDEPVVLVTYGDRSHIRHLPSCSKTARRRAKDAKKPSRNRRRNADTLHVYPTRPGAAQAVEVGLPLTPRTLFVIGPRGENRPLHQAVTGAEAVALADEVNGRLIAHAYEWVAANPVHPTFRELTFPAPGPIIQACDGGTAISRDLDQPPSPRRPSLLGRDRPATTA
jgi:hypothetical protein